jgi:hypothetical protein
VRDIRYRFAPDTEWRSTGPDPEINLVTGERSPNPTLAVDPLRIAPGRLRIGYADMPAEASFLCVQLVFRDGEVTEPQRFAPDK